MRWFRAFCQDDFWTPSRGAVSGHVPPERGLGADPGLAREIIPPRWLRNASASLWRIWREAEDGNFAVNGCTDGGEPAYRGYVHANVV